MNEIDLLTKIEGLEKAIKEHKDFTNTYESQLTTTKKQLVDYNKPEITPRDADNIWEAVNDAISEFAFDDSDNYEFEYELDYDGRVNCSNIDFQSNDELIDKIDLITKDSKKYTKEVKRARQYMDHRWMEDNIEYYRNIKNEIL